MYLDAFTLSALVDEFLDTLAGGRVQDVLDVDAAGIGLEIYAEHQRHYLYISADKLTPRIHTVPDKLRRGLPKPTQLGLLLRRKVEGGRVTHISQPPWERIIQLDFDGPEGAVSLIVEPMERRSNVLLIEDGQILDCLRRVGPDENRVRVSLPGHAYVPPPAQSTKHDPSQCSSALLAALLAANDDPKRKTQQALSGGLLGISPLLAREIVHRSGASIDQRAVDANADRLAVAVQAVIEPLMRRDWQPGIVDSDRGVTAYTVYPLTHVEGWRPVDTASAAMTAFYSPPEGVDAYRAGKQPVAEAIAEAKARVTARLAALRRSMTDDAERELLRQQGELILAYQYTIVPKQTELRAQYESDQPELIIALDTALTPLENAQRYFDRYNRAKRALDDVPTLIEGASNDLAFLDQLATDLDLAASWPDIDEVQVQLEARGYWKGKAAARSGGQRSAPLRIVHQDGFVIWVGRNSRQNEAVTFDKGGPQDLWLHARGIPGAHVIIKVDGRTIPDEVIGMAASLAAYYSARRDESKVEVDITYRRHVRKIKGGNAGQVTYRQEQTRTAAPRSEKAI